MVVIMMRVSVFLPQTKISIPEAERQFSINFLKISSERIKFHIALRCSTG